MFCPSCGVKYEGTPIQCASCKKTIPSLEGERSAGARPRSSRRAGAAAIEGLGSVGDRMLALLMDRVLIAALLLIVGAAIADQWASVEPRLPSVVAGAVLGGFALVTVVFLYHFVFEAGFGTTLGKAIMGLQVRNHTDRNRIAAVAIRNALRIIDGLAFYLVGFLVATFSKQRQRLGDRVGGTVVMDMPMSNGARGAMMMLWAAVIVASVVIAAAVCPACRLG